MATDINSGIPNDEIVKLGFVTFSSKCTNTNQSGVLKNMKYKINYKICSLVSNYFGLILDI